MKYQEEDLKVKVFEEIRQNFSLEEAKSTLIKNYPKFDKKRIEEGTFLWIVSSNGSVLDLDKDYF